MHTDSTMNNDRHIAQWLFFLGLRHFYYDHSWWRNTLNPVRPVNRRVEASNGHATAHWQFRMDAGV